MKASFVLLCAALAHLSSQAAISGETVVVDGKEILAKIQAFDAVYDAKFRCEGNQSNPPSPLFGGRPKQCKFRFTRQDNVRVLEQEFQITPASGSDSTTLEREKSVVLQDHDLSGQFHKNVAFSPSETGPTKTDFSNSLDLNPPDSREYFFFTKAIMWASGRGFSPHLKAVTDVRVDGNGLIGVTASGMLDEDEPGRWELQVDPTNAYLVRHAEFYNAKGNRGLTITTDGVRDNSDCIYPENGMFRMELGGLNVDYLYEFLNASLEVDVGLLASARALMDGTYPANTLVHDGRTKPATTFSVDHDGKIIKSKTEEPVKGPAGRNSLRRISILFAVNVLVVGFVIWLYKREKAREGNE